MPFTDELAEYIIRSVRDLATQVNDARLGETPFVNGVLAPSSGGTGIANADASTLTLLDDGTLDLGGFTLTLTANTTLSGAPAPANAKYIVQTADATLTAEQALSALATGILKNTTTTGVLSIATGSDLPTHTHAGTDITTGTVPAARLGSGSATATTLLHGDSTWSAVDITAETTGTLTIARGGTGATSAGAALTALGAAAASHVHAGADITSGTVAAARLGASPTAAKLLFGDNTWASLVAADIPTHTHAAGDVTTGTMATARLGSGTANDDVFLRGDSTWSSAVGGSLSVGTQYLIGADVVASRSSNTLNIADDTTWTGVVINVGGNPKFSAGATTNFLYQHTSPDTAGTRNLGDASNYWGDISYKTITDRGCLPWCDDGVELQDGRVVSDVQALLEIKPHPYLRTPAGAVRLDYATLPKHVYRAAEIAKEPVYNPDGTVRFRGGEKVGDDGAELTALVGILIGAIKELNTRLVALEEA